MPQDTLATARKFKGMLVKDQPCDLIVLLLGFALSGCSILNQDPIYAQKKYEQAVEAMMQERALACVADYGVFWVRNGDWVETGDGYLIVLDTTGKQHTLSPHIANPSCTPKD